MEENIYIICGALSVYVMMLVGAIGAFIPVVPGPLLAGLALLGLKLILPMSISWWLVGAGIFVAVFAQVVDLVATWLGAKKFGATWRGTLGAFLGVFIGMFMPPPIIWIFIAPFILAFLFEWLGGAEIQKATNAGIGAFLGCVFASVIKFLMVVFLALWFSIELVLPLFK